MPYYHRYAERILKSLFANKFIVAILFGLALWLMFELRHLLALIFIAYVIMAALAPAAAALKRKGLVNMIAVALPYGVFISILILFGLLFWPVLKEQASLVSEALAGKLEAGTAPASFFGIDFSYVIQNALFEVHQTLGGNLVELVGSSFEVLFSIFTVFVLSLYLLYDRDRLYRAVVESAHAAERKQISFLIVDLENKMGAWARGQIFTSAVVGTLIGFSMYALEMPYAPTLGLLAGFLEMIPFLGPALASVPAIILASSVSMTQVLAVIGIFSVVQILENNLLLPQVMKYSVKLNPVVVIIGVLAGAQLLGVLGALVAIPFIAFATEIGKYVVTLKASKLERKLTSNA